MTTQHNQTFRNVLIITGQTVLYIDFSDVAFDLLNYPGQDLPVLVLHLCLIMLYDMLYLFNTFKINVNSFNIEIIQVLKIIISFYVIKYFINYKF